MYAFMAFLEQHQSFSGKDYQTLHQWSVDNKELFWQAVWQFFKVNGSAGDRNIENASAMPGARWLPEAKLNFAENLLSFSQQNADKAAIVERGEHGRREVISYRQLHEQVAYLSQYLKALGVQKGDCVAGFLPNSQYSIIAMLATASLGAIWSSCSPDFGFQGVQDRFSQIKPKVLLACDGYYYAGKCINSMERVNQISQSLDSLVATIIVPYLNNDSNKADRQTDSIKSSYTLWETLFEGEAPKLVFEAMRFDDPLYVMYSSGTTGKPKCIIHTVGGTLLQHLKELALHTDVTSNSNLFYYTTCGWMMWNWLVSGLALGATIIVFDGSPFHPTQTVLFDLIDEENIDIFGASAKYYSACEKYDLKPKQSHKLDSLNTLLSTGSPLSHESFAYLYQDVKQDICVSSISGGTDIISCFALGCPILPVYQGELQCLGLGMDVQFWDDNGQALNEGKGELVCKSSFPSMPSGFWNDVDNTKYQQAYFDRFDNVWAHGDYGEIITHVAVESDPKKNGVRPQQKGVIIHGRSDAVLNPGGVRIGTAEIYRQVEKIDAVFETIAIGQQWEDDVRVILFVRLQDGIKLDDILVTAIKQIIRLNTTPRHVPRKIIQVADIPRTLSGKIVELAVRKIVHGEEVTNKDALANPDALDLFKDLPDLQEN